MKCMYIYIYIHMYMCIYIYVCVCVCVCLCVCVFMALDLGIQSSEPPDPTVKVLSERCRFRGFRAHRTRTHRCKEQNPTSTQFPIFP